jgi:molybdate transport system regulatory protein
MANRKKNPRPGARAAGPRVPLKSLDHGRIVASPDEARCLDTVQLNHLEQSFRRWVSETPRADVRLSRRRMLLMFLLIRYTGAKLNEVLALNPFTDIDHRKQTVLFRSADPDGMMNVKEAPLSQALSSEIQSALADPLFKESLRNTLHVDPGFARRKFYERAQSCGFPKHLGGPEMIRKSRAVELMQGNVPLPAVQMLLGHSTPSLTTAYVTFSGEEIRQVTRHFLETESFRKTSARNSFYGKIHSIRRGDIQTRVDLTSIEGHRVVTVITNDSVERLGIKTGRLVTAEVKAPWISLIKDDREPVCTADNKFNGAIVRINRGKISSEYIVRISGGTELCSIVTTESGRTLDLKKGDDVWAIFNCFAVVLHID